MRIRFYTAGSRKGLKKGKTRAPPFKNHKNCNTSTNTHPHKAFYVGKLYQGEAHNFGLVPGPATVKNIKSILVFVPPGVF